MNSDAKRLSGTFRRNLDIIERDTRGFDDTALNRRLGEGSSVNWVIGHVLSSRTRVLDILHKTVDGLDVEKVRVIYERGTQPGAAAAYPLADLLRLLELAQIEIEEGLINAELAVEVESPLGTMPLENLIGFYAWHEGYHAGQVALLKRWLETLGSAAD